MLPVVTKQKLQLGPIISLEVKKKIKNEEDPYLQNVYAPITFAIHTRMLIITTLSNPAER